MFKIVNNERLSDNMFRVTFEAPLVARKAQPGQFLMFRVDKFGDVDLGYPRMFQRTDGRVVTIYYWSQPDRPESCIAATLWSPPAP